MGKTFITGDTHGGSDSGTLRFYSKNFPEGKKLTREDYMIIVGDFGGVWFPPTRLNEKGDEIPNHNWNKKDRPFQDFLVNNKPWTTLFVDGNHENHELLAELEQVPMFGGTVGKVRDHMYHLKRGEIYVINGKKYFVMGGAASYDKENRTIGINWWQEEVPSYAEMDYALENLEKHNWEVDVVLTHNCPEYVAAMFMSQEGSNGRYDYKFKDPIASFLEHIRGKLKFDKWYFGHWHHNWTWENFEMLYKKIVQVK